MSRVHTTFGEQLSKGSQVWVKILGRKDDNRCVKSSRGDNLAVFM